MAIRKKVVGVKIPILKNGKLKNMSMKSMFLKIHGRKSKQPENATRVRVI